MKRAALIISAVILILMPLHIQAAETPELQAITFKNAHTEEPFSPAVHEYGLILENPPQTPTLNSYQISGEGNVFATYLYDVSNHPTGICITLEYEGGTAIYQFHYKNAPVYEENDNNYLLSLSCPLCEIYPKINKRTTEYKLYIPSDLTVLRFSVATQNAGATCDLVREFTLTETQEPMLHFTVTATNGEARTYRLQIKHLDKTSEEVRAIMAMPDFTSLVHTKQFYQKPAFIIVFSSGLGGILLIGLFILLTGRIIRKVEDSDETEFFD